MKFLIVLQLCCLSALSMFVPENCPVFSNTSDTFFNRSILSWKEPKRYVHYFEIIGHMKFTYETGINVFYTPFTRYLIATFEMNTNSRSQMRFGISCQANIASNIQNWHTSFNFDTDMHGNVKTMRYYPQNLRNMKEYDALVDQRQIAVRFLQAGDYFAVWGCHQLEERQSDQAAYVFFSHEAKRIDNSTDYEYHLQMFLNSLNISQPSVRGIKSTHFDLNAMTGDNRLCSKSSNVSVMSMVKHHFANISLETTRRGYKLTKQLSTAALIVIAVLGAVYLIVSLVLKRMNRSNKVGVVYYIN